MKFILVCILFLFLLYCKEKKTCEQTQNEPLVLYDCPNLNEVSENDSIEGILITKALDGDRVAFNHVFVKYFTLHMKEDELLYYSMLIAHKYNNPEAYYAVFQGFNSYKSGENMKKLDKKTRKLAFYYLLKSYELGYKYSESNLINEFGSNIPKSSTLLEEFSKMP